MSNSLHNFGQPPESAAPSADRPSRESIPDFELLTRLVQRMVNESGNPEGFDAAQWLYDWMTDTVPALGDKTPLSFMHTNEGRQRIAQLLAMSQSGAYA